jgi:hypothetical protein
VSTGFAALLGSGFEISPSRASILSSGRLAALEELRLKNVWPILFVLGLATYAYLQWTGRIGST